MVVFGDDGMAMVEGMVEGMDGGGDYNKHLSIKKKKRKKKGGDDHTYMLVQFRTP